MGMFERAGWHSEDPRHSKASGMMGVPGTKHEGGRGRGGEWSGEAGISLAEPRGVG